MFGEFGNVECQRNSNYVTKTVVLPVRRLALELRRSTPSCTITKKSFVLHSLTSRRPKKKVVVNSPSFHFFVSVKAEEKSRVRETTSTLFRGNKGTVVE